MRFTSTLLLFIFLGFNSYAQIDIYSLMERTDLRIDSIEKLADQHFLKVGTSKGSGYKQYQRWLYERKYHLDDKGYFIAPAVENASYQKFVSNQKKYKAGTISWSELGPKSWSYTSGWNPGVGRVTGVAVHPSDTTKIYVTTFGGGIWKSTNSGSSWTPLIDNVNSGWMSLYNICIDPNNQSILYASLASGGVIKSTNSGATWAATGSGPSVPRKVLIQPNNSNNVFAACGNGIWRSTNAGTSWTQVNTTAMEDIEFNTQNRNLMYASGSSGTSCVWRSTNNGASWTAIGSSSGITASGRTLIGVSPNNPAIVYAVQASGNVFGKFYKSSDSGLTYTTLITGSSSAGTNYFGYETNGTGTTGQATYDMAMCVNPANVNEIHIAGIICFKSTNGGSSFTAETNWSYPNSLGYNHADVHVLEWFKGSIYSGSDGGIYKSVNKGDDWIDLSNGLGIKQVYRIACSKTNSTVMTLGAQDNGSSFRQTNGAWKDWLGGDGMDNIISPTNAAIAIGTTQNGGILKTTTSGSSFSSISQPSAGNWVTPICYHPTSHDTVYAGWTGIWRSDNGGSNWTNISSTTITSKMVTLAVAPSNPRYIYGSIGATLYRTSNGGASWSSVTAAASINSICVSPSNPQKIWIACNSSSARVYVSTNMGSSFTDLSSGLPSMAARSVAVDDNSWEGLYVGMNIGVYYRDNTNTTWIQHGTNLPLVSINEVEIQKSGGKLRVATYGRGVWESNLQSVSSCPNPTNLTTTNISTSGATIGWTAQTGAASYKVQYKASSSSTWSNTLTTTGTSMNLTGLSTGVSYDWQVKTKCSADSSTFVQSSFTTATPCAATSGLTISNLTSTGVTVTWTSVTGAVSYAFEYKTASSSTWIRSSVTTGTSKSLTGLTSGIAYDCRVKTKCLLDSSNYVQSTFTTPTCTAPANLSNSSITATGATISWSAATSAINYTFEYKLASSSTWVGTTTQTGTSKALTGLTAGAIYDWRVRTNCSSSNSAFVQSTFTTLCTAPTGLKGTNSTSDSSTISWNASTGAVSYTFEYKLSYNSIWTNTTNTNNISERIGILNAGSGYNWQVRANCPSVSSSYVASMISTTCIDPTSFTNTSITTNSSSFSWNSARNTIYYLVSYKPSSSSTWSSNALVFGTTYTLSGLSSGVTYDIRLQSKCNANNSNWQQLTFTTNTNCSSPTGLSITNLTSTSAKPCWSKVSSATNYTFEYKQSTSSTWSGSTTTTDTFVNLTSLTSGKNHDWRVRANCSGGSSAFSQSSLGTPCPQPTNASTSGISESTATLAWSAASGAINYTVEYKLSSSSSWTNTYTTTNSYISLSGLTPGTSYDWRVKTNCSSFGSSYLQSSFTTDCGSPSNLHFTSATTSSATIYWDKVPGATSYTTEYKNGSSSTWTGTNMTSDTFYSISGLAGGTNYDWRVRTNCTSGSSSFSTSAFSTTCDAPSTLSSSNIGYDSAIISWSAVSGATGYIIEHRITGSSSWTGTTTVSGTNHHLTGLTPGIDHDWQVNTLCYSGSSALVQSSFTTNCPPPLNLYTSNKTSSGATVRWSKGSFATGYIVEFKLASSSTWTAASTTTDTFYTFSGLSSGLRYDWRIKTSCAVNESNYSTSYFITACDMPVSLNTSGVNDSSCTLTWSSVSGANNYIIEYKTNSGSTWIRKGTTTNLSYYLGGLSSGTSYLWRIKTKCSLDSSAFNSSSFSTTAPCGIPTNLSVSNLTTNSSTLSWSATSGAVNYTLDYKLSTSSTWINLTTTSSTTYNLSSLSSGNTYNWRVRTNCTSGISNYAQTSFVTLCDSPSGLSVSNITTNSGKVIWKKSSSALNYSLEYKSNGSSTWINAGSTTDTSVTLSSLNTGTAYDCRAKVNCNSTSSSTTSSTFTTSCTAPAGLSVSGITADSATLAWNAISGVPNYTVEYRISGSSSWISAGTFTGNNIRLGNLSAGTLYNWQIKSNCNANVSSFAQSSFTTNCSDITNLTTSAVGVDSASFTWTAAANASYYIVNYKTSASSTWSSNVNIYTNSYNLTGLSSGVSYDFRIQTKCNANNSSYQQKTFTTNTVCNSPSGLNSSNVTSSGATLAWGAVTGASSYAIEYKLSTSSGWTSAGSTTNTSVNFTGLSSGLVYNWRVRTNCSSGNSGFTQANFTTLCPTPTGFAATNITTDSATFNWNAVSGASNYTLEFKLTSSSSWTNAGTFSGTSKRLGGMSAGNQFNWQIKANCSAVGSGYTQTNVTTPCSDITNLTTASVGQDSAAFSWNAASNASYYIVNFKTSASSTWSSNVNVYSTSYVLKGLNSGSGYDFRVQAKCNINSSSFQQKSFTTTTSTCAAPGNLNSSSITATGATISWSAATSAVNYTIEYKLASSSSWTGTSTQTGTSKVLTGLDVGSTYDWRVRTNCSSGNSAYSQGSFNTLCNSPSNLTVTFVTIDSATISWVGANGANSYTLEYKPSFSSTWANTTTVNGTTFRIGGLTSGTGYNVQIKSNCSAGGSSFVSCNLVTICPEVENFAVSSVSTNSASFTWTSAKNVLYYIVNYKASSSSTWSSNALVFGSSYTLTGLSTGISYDFRIETKCNAKNSNRQTLTFTTGSSCSSPSRLGTSNVSNSGITLKWSYLSSATNYTVEYKAATSSTWTGTTNTSDTTISLSGLAAGTNYDWRVRSNCSGANSAFSQGSFTTVCEAPTGFSASNASIDSVTLSWNSVSGVSDYSLQYKIHNNSTWTAGPNASGTSIRVGGMNSGTGYNWQIKSNCASIGSSYEQTNVSTTCPDPSSLTTTNISGTEATISWNSARNGIYYLVQYKAGSSSSWSTEVIEFSSSYTLTGLNPGTTYDFRVQTKCMVNNSSYISTSFTTVCKEVTQLITDNTTSNSANVSWNKSSGSTNYTVHYKTGSSSTWTSAGTTSDTTKTFNSLSAGIYNWRVKANCPSNNSNFESSNFTIYCASKGDTTYFEHIKYINLGSITRTSGNDNGYYFASNLNTNLKPGDQYTITFAPGFSGAKYTENWAFFIDYNQNGTFTETGEQIGTKTTTDTGKTSITFTVPNSASLGNTRLRASMRYGGAPSGCSSFSFGEVEEYPLTITTTPSLDAVAEDPMREVRKIHLYPVPVSKLLYLSYELAIHSNSASLEIVNLLGQVVHTKELNGEKGLYNNVIDLSDVNSGLYFLNIKTDHGIETKKFQIAK